MIHARKEVTRGRDDVIKMRNNVTDAVVMKTSGRQMVTATPAEKEHEPLARTLRKI